jgi:hypothetical protein
MRSEDSDTMSAPMSGPLCQAQLLGEVDHRAPIGLWRRQTSIAATSIRGVDKVSHSWFIEHVAAQALL